MPRFDEWLIDWEDERDVADRLYLSYQPPIKHYYSLDGVYSNIERMQIMSLEEILINEENILEANYTMNNSDDFTCNDGKIEVVIVDSSSHILQITYESIKAILQIDFNNGSAYEYYDVPQYEWENFKAADSKGRYAHENIYNYYRQNRIR